MVFWQKFGWLCAGGSVAAAAVVYTIANGPEPEFGQPLPIEGVPVVSITPEPVLEPKLSAAPEISDELDIGLSSQNLGESSNSPLAADSTVTVAKAQPLVASTSQALAAPQIAADLNQIEAPTLPQVLANTSVSAETPVSAGFNAPLSLAQVLPPGIAPSAIQIAPSFDLVRVSPDGSAIIAGRAEPFANVQIFSGNVPIAEAKASAQGEFVVFISNPSEPTLDLNIPAPPEGAQYVVSQDDIVILPPLAEASEAAPIVLRRTPDAIQIVQPSGPAIPSNISLDLVSYSANGAVQLAGRGQPGNLARIYVNGDYAGESPIASGGNWGLEITNLAEGRYVLRVDEVSNDGKVTSRTSSPFQRVFPAANTPDSFSQGAKIIVQPGNTLWLMATEAYGDGDAYTQIFTANREAITDPDLIFPGQILSIPRSAD